ncbi:fasciclin domain-containing protein [Congregibacter sp.]|uniref:fasciclin domain-containing protein n=1 Tax=Congregibacter sp. TaxID=2744308 RepID=UPI00385CFD17
MSALSSTRRLLTQTAGILFSVVLLAACNDSNNLNTPPVPESPPVAEGPGNIVEVAVEAGDFSTLVAALEATGLDQTLADEAETFTVFAPTDAAFEALGQETIDALLADTETLSDILLYHVIAGQAVNADTALSLTGTTVEMANGDIVALTIQSDALFINGSQVIVTDVEASNGIIHAIDAVLTPPGDAEPTGNIVEVAVAAGDFTTLVAAVQAAGLDTTLADPDGSFTVFAPTDAAFAMLGDDAIAALLADIDALTDILLYHVISGAAVDSITATSLFGEMVEMANGDSVTIDIRDGALFINDSQVVIADVPATNGVIHAIDMVLTRPADEVGTIVDVAVANGSFTTLVAALQATGLDATLADETATFTVFAPTDDAFALLGEETINTLLADTETLSDILLYHVIAEQAVPAETALTLNGSDVEMANGDTITITVTDGNLFINDSQVVIADVQASNGIIHAINAVLTPPM